jgi:hypothetical protein
VIVWWPRADRPREVVVAGLPPLNHQRWSISASPVGLPDRRHLAVQNTRSRFRSVRERAGRRNHYTINTEGGLRHPVEDDHTVGELLAMLGRLTSPVTTATSFAAALLARVVLNGGRTELPLGGPGRSFGVLVADGLSSGLVLLSTTSALATAVFAVLDCVPGAVCPSYWPLSLAQPPAHR